MRTTNESTLPSAHAVGPGQSKSRVCLLLVALWRADCLGAGRPPHASSSQADFIHRLDSAIAAFSQDGHKAVHASTVAGARADSFDKSGVGAHHTESEHCATPAVVARLGVATCETACPKRTALHKLVQWRCYTSARHLVERCGAELLLQRDDDGLSPLVLALMDVCLPSNTRPLDFATWAIARLQTRDRDTLDLALQLNTFVQSGARPDTATTIATAALKGCLDTSSALPHTALVACLWSGDRMPYEPPCDSPPLLETDTGVTTKDKAPVDVTYTSARQNDASSNWARDDDDDDSETRSFCWCERKGRSRASVCMRSRGISVHDASPCPTWRRCYRLRLSQCVALLVRAGCNLALPTPWMNGHTPLHMCAAFRHEDQLRVLLHHGADPNARNKLDETPLLIAVATRGGETIARLLLAAGADPDLAMGGGIAPICACVASRAIGDEPIAQVAALIAAQADVNATAPDGSTPLMLAAARNYMHVAGMLLDAGADRRRTWCCPLDQREGRDTARWPLPVLATAADIARHLGHHELVHLIDGRGAPVPLPAPPSPPPLGSRLPVCAACMWGDCPGYAVEPSSPAAVGSGHPCILSQPSQPKKRPLL